MDAETLVCLIKDFVLHDKSNMIPGFEGEPFFDEPLVRFADILDPLFNEFKQIIYAEHLTPLEWLELSFPGEKFAEGTVISYILPISEKTRASNRGQKKYPSLRWAFTRNDGEKFNNKLRDHIVKVLTDHGFKAVAPLRTDFFTRVIDAKVGIASNWSERHAAMPQVMAHLV